jgi:micrococcal nuclease
VHRGVSVALAVGLVSAGSVALAGCGPASLNPAESITGGTVRSDATRGSASSAPSSPVAGPVPVEPLQGPFEVVQVVDGDTVKIATAEGRLTLRLIGIDTPETVHPTKPVECYGPEASDEAKRLLRGQQVWVELDPGQGATDKYDRLLVYLWTSPTEMFNWHMIRDGFATEYTYDTAYNHRGAFLAAVRAAVADQRGSWSECQTPGAG